MKKLLTFAVALAFLAAPVVTAQSDGTMKKEPDLKVAKILVINREDIKIGRESDHDNYVRALRQNAAANENVTWVAARSLSGNTQEQFFFAGYDSFAELERNRSAMTGFVRTTVSNTEASRDNIETHLAKKGLIAKLRTDLSYNAERIDPANYKAWEMGTVRLKPGASSAFADVMKTVVDLHKQNSIDEDWLTYEVAYGSNTPTFIFFTPRKSIADLDDESLKEVHKRVFTKTVEAAFDAQLKDAILTEENALLSVAPESSKVPARFVAANPSLWTVSDTEQVYSASASRDRGRRSVVEPATQKKEKKN